MRLNRFFKTSGQVIAVFTFVFLSLHITVPGLQARGIGSDYSGTDGLSLLQIELNSRVNGLGGAYCAASEDITGLSSNPAGIVYLARKQFAFVHLDWLDDTSLEYFAYAQPMLGGVLAGSVTWLRVPDFENYDRSGYSLGQIDMKNSVFALAYGRRVKRVSLGGQLKLGYLSASDIQARAVALDLGAQFYIRHFNIKLPGGPVWSVKGLKTGIALQNLSSKAYTDNVPVKFKAGLYYPVIENLFLTLDLNKYIYRFDSLIDGDYRLNLGAEYNFKDLVYVRTGFRLGYDLNFFTAGLGIRYRFGGTDSSVDYVYSPYGIMGNVNNVSVNMKFEDFKFNSGLTPDQKKMLEMHYYTGLSFFIREQWEKAILEWEKALELDPDNKLIKKRMEETEEIMKIFGK